jgi:hypothetical protein
MSTLDLYTAGHGDCIVYTWGDPRKRILIDGGPQHFRDDLHRMLMALPEGERTFELLVITHVDDDHIGGWVEMLERLAPVPGLAFKDVWFNGWLQLGGQRMPAKPSVEHFGPAQAERISRLLYERRMPWNQAFDRGPVCTTAEVPYPTVKIDDEVSLQVLGPHARAMQAMRDEWDHVVSEAWQPPEPQPEPPTPGVEKYGGPPSIASWEDLEDLAATTNPLDSGEANGSSIALLLSHGDLRILLAGDAHAPDLVAAIGLLSPGKPMRLDAFKLPHHGSKKNVTAELMRAVDCSRVLISTNGAKFKHPDAEAVARVLVNSRERPTIVFNAVSPETTAWRDSVQPMVPDRFDLRYPEDEIRVRVSFDEA